MSYQALARKWRPGSFQEVIGQEHVVQALSNALDRDQVHHAFLFSGTRGVGKTTLARIFAKALNCDNGVSSVPCNECGSCKAIDQARFVDLIEVDAASRTRVDDTRELLDNVQYTPTTGRYKVYLIDEVHMLSAHSFNALLKTLEEPPPHVKFLLATTDPQKLPVTILSRCLQFHLRALSADQIRYQLQTICKAEAVEADEGALVILAGAADGSMRDALSLLDQGLAYGAGVLGEPLVRKMMGTLGDDVAERVMRALIENDIDNLLGVVADMAELSVDYRQVLDEILLQLFNLSLLQLAPKSLEARQSTKPWHAGLVSQTEPEDLQLYYQIGLLGKRDLSLAPDPRTGLEMTLLRMIAFRPKSTGGSIPHLDGTSKPTGASASDTVKTSGQSKIVSMDVSAESQNDVPVVKTDTSAPSDAVKTSGQSKIVSMEVPAESQNDVPVVKTDSPTSEGSDEWANLAARMPVNGVTRELVMNLGLREKTDQKLYFDLDPSHEHLLDSTRVQMINDVLCELGVEVSIDIEIRRSSHQTLAQQKIAQEEKKMQEAEKALGQDPNVQAIQDKFGASMVENSIRIRD